MVLMLALVWWLGRAERKGNMHTQTRREVRSERIEATCIVYLDVLRVLAMIECEIHVVVEGRGGGQREKP